MSNSTSTPESTPKSTPKSTPLSRRQTQLFSACLLATMAACFGAALYYIHLPVSSADQVRSFLQEDWQKTLKPQFDLYRDIAVIYRRAQKEKPGISLEKVVHHVAIDIKMPQVEMDRFLAEFDRYDTIAKEKTGTSIRHMTEAEFYAFYRRYIHKEETLPTPPLPNQI